MGFFYRTIRIVENGIKPAYVFDGKPPELKAGVVRTLPASSDHPISYPFSSSQSVSKSAPKRKKREKKRKKQERLKILIGSLGGLSKSQKNTTRNVDGY
jgi:5'-3' exonuclease